MFGNIVRREKISSETDPLNIDIMNDNCSVVISSRGGAAIHVGDCLGQYFPWAKKIYKQLNTEIGQKPNYIYYYDSTKDSKGWLAPTTEVPYTGCWRVSNVPNGGKYWLVTDICFTLPETGWKYWDGKQYKSDDSSLVLIRGPITVSGDITITGDITDKCPQGNPAA